MSQRLGRRWIGTGILIGVASQTLAQDAGAPILSFSISERVSYETNRDLEPDEEAAVYSRTNLGVDLVTGTPTSTFELGFGGQILREFSDGEELEFSGPNASVAYSTRTAGSRLRLSSRYSRSEIDTIDPIDLLEVDGDTGEVIVPEDLDDIDGEGTRESISYRARYEWGLDAPVGGNLDLGATTIRYSDASDPDLEDIQEYSANLGGRVALSPVLVARASLGYRFEEEGEDTTDSINTVLGLSLERPMQTLGLDLGITRGEDDGYRSSLTGTVDRELGRGGSFALTAGLTNTISGEAALTGSVTYAATPYPTGNVQFGLSRSVTDDVEDGEEYQTAINAAYGHRINRQLGLNFTARYAEQEQVGRGDSSTDGRLTASLDRQLTEDWSFSTGLSHTFTTDSGADDESSNAVFFQIGRSFLTRF